MKKVLALIIGFAIIAMSLVALELLTHDYTPQKDKARELSASIITQTNELQEQKKQQEKKLFTQENLENEGYIVEIVDEGMTDLFLGEININPLLARKRLIKLSEGEEIIINEVDKIKNYPLLLTAGYSQQEDKYKMSETSKESFLILSNTDTNKFRFVTQGKDTIIGLLYDQTLQEEVSKILEKLGYETP